MKNFNLPQLILIVLLLLLNTLNIYPQKNRDKSFLKLAEKLSTSESFNKYKDRVPAFVGTTYKLKISDLKYNPIFKSTIEEDEFIIVPYNKIEKSYTDFYLKLEKVLISKDSSYIEFTIVNKKDMKINGTFSLIPKTPADASDYKNFTTRATINEKY